MKKEFKNKATKAINFFLDNVMLILSLFLVTIEYMRRMNIPDFVEDFICAVGLCLVVFVGIWRLFFGEIYILDLPTKVNEKVKSILKNNKYKGSRKGYHIFILVLTALYGATILYTYIHEGKIWISGGPVDKDTVYFFSNIIYIFSLLLSLTALKSVLPDLKKIFTEEFGLQTCGDNTYYNENAQFPFYFSYETIKLDEPLMERAIGIKKYRNLLYSDKSETMQIYGKLVFTNMTLSMIIMNLRRVQEEYSYLIIKPIAIDGKIIVEMRSRKDYYNTVSAKYVLALLISMYEVGESFGRENEHDYEEIYRFLKKC